MKTNFALITILALLGPAQAQERQLQNLPLAVPFRLVGGGYSCSGYIHVARQNIVWKSSFRTCRASSWSAKKEKSGSWLIQLHQTISEHKACPMGLIEMRPEFPNTGAPPWELAGYETLAGYRQAPDRPVLDCNMDKQAR